LVRRRDAPPECGRLLGHSDAPSGEASRRDTVPVHR
jgi:hypothetical protein